MTAAKKSPRARQSETLPKGVNGTKAPPKPTQSKAGHAKHMKAMGYK